MIFYHVILFLPKKTAWNAYKKKKIRSLIIKINHFYLASFLQGNKILINGVQNSLEGLFFFFFNFLQDSYEYHLSPTDTKPCFNCAIFDKINGTITLSRTKLHMRLVWLLSPILLKIIYINYDKIDVLI